MKTDRIRGRLALVTGAGRGLGEAIARALAERGARVIVCDIDREANDRVADALGAVDRAALDVADGGAMLALAARIHREHGPLGVLVNNAGVVAAAPTLEMALDDWRWMLDINVMGVINGCHAFGPAMVEAVGRGHIVNIASAAAFNGLPMMAGYAVSKAAVLSYSEGLRAEVDEAALGVSVICPGFLPTAIGASGRYPGGELGERLRRRAGLLLDRKGRHPDEVGRAVVAAIDRDRFLVPLYFEGWASLTLRSVPSGVRRRLMPWLERRVEAMVTGG